MAFASLININIRAVVLTLSHTINCVRKTASPSPTSSKMTVLCIASPPQRVSTRRSDSSCACLRPNPVGSGSPGSCPHHTPPARPLYSAGPRPILNRLQPSVRLCCPSSYCYSSPALCAALLSLILLLLPGLCTLPALVPFLFVSSPLCCSAVPHLTVGSGSPGSCPHLAPAFITLAS